MYIRGAGLITLTEDMYDKLLDEVKALKKENDELIKTRNEILDFKRRFEELTCSVETRLKDQRRSYKAELKEKDETIQHYREAYFSERLKRMMYEKTIDGNILNLVSKLIEKEGDKNNG